MADIRELPGLAGDGSLGVYHGLSRYEETRRTQAAHDSAQAERDARAAAENVPEWILRVRAGLTRARSWGKDAERYGVVRQRQDGSWFWYDATGSFQNLPGNAGKWFAAGQTEVLDHITR